MAFDEIQSYFIDKHGDFMVIYILGFKPTFGNSNSTQLSTWIARVLTCYDPDPEAVLPPLSAFAWFRFGGTRCG